MAEGKYEVIYSGEAAAAIATIVATRLHATSPPRSLAHLSVADLTTGEPAERSAVLLFVLDCDAEGAISADARKLQRELRKLQQAKLQQPPFAGRSVALVALAKSVCAFSAAQGGTDKVEQHTHTDPTPTPPPCPTAVPHFRAPPPCPASVPHFRAPPPYPISVPHLRAPPPSPTPLPHLPTPPPHPTSLPHLPTPQYSGAARLEAALCRLGAVAVLPLCGAECELEEVDVSLFPWLDQLQAVCEGRSPTANSPPTLTVLHSGDLAEEIAGLVLQRAGTLNKRMLSMERFREWSRDVGVGAGEKPPSRLLLVFIVATVENEQAPEAAGRCVRWFNRKDNAEGCLEGVHYAVFGLGDSNLLLDRQTTSAKDCNQVAQALESRLRALGATPFYRYGEADDRTGNSEVDPWLVGLQPRLEAIRRDGWAAVEVPELAHVEHAQDEQEKTPPPPTSESQTRPAEIDPPPSKDPPSKDTASKASKASKGSPAIDTPSNDTPSKDNPPLENGSPARPVREVSTPPTVPILGGVKGAETAASSPHPPPAGTPTARTAPPPPEKAAGSLDGRWPRLLVGAAAVALVAAAVLRRKA